MLCIEVKTIDYSQSEGYDVKFKLDYANVPVMFNHKIKENFAKEVGLKFDLLVSAKNKNESPVNSVKNELKDKVKTICFGANLGVNYQLDSDLNFGLRYNLGFTVIPDKSNWNIKNGVFQFSRSYRF